jgi:hypothetical protein
VDETYFKMHYEVVPTSGMLHLPDNYMRDELYQICKQDLEAQKERYVHYSQFTRLWNAKFDNVVTPRKVCIGVCEICANLKSMIKAIRTNDAEKDACQKLLKEHHDSQAQERLKAMHHRG